MKKMQITGEPTPVPGLLGPKPFRPGTSRPKSIFFTVTPRPSYKNTLFVAYNGKQMYIYSVFISILDLAL